MLDARKRTIGLSLPDGVTEAPQRRQDEEHWQKMSVWNPDKEKNDEGGMQDAANGDERFAVHVTLCAANQTGAHGVGHAQNDHAVADVLDADRTADVRLQHAAHPPLLVYFAAPQHHANTTSFYVCLYTLHHKLQQHKLFI